MGMALSRTSKHDISGKESGSIAWGWLSPGQVSMTYHARIKGPIAFGRLSTEQISITSQVRNQGP